MNKLPFHTGLIKKIKNIDDEHFEYLLHDTIGFMKPLFKSRKNLEKHSNIESFLKEYNYPKSYGKYLLIILEEQISRDLKKIALLQYLHMKRTDDWGDLGEQRILISYCRHLLGISNDKEVTQFNADTFMQKIEEMALPYNSLKPERLRKIDEQIKCHIFYRKVDYSKEDEINKMLEFLGSNKGLIAGQLGIYRSVIYGEADIKKMSGYRVTTFINEIERTPGCVLSIAAVVGGKHIAMRHASCETIFANKWCGLFRMQSFETYFNLLNKYENIGLAFKIKAVNAYKVKTETAILKKKELFIDEILEGLIWHELGHGIVINGLLSKEDSAFGEALGVLGANVISVMKEIVADWAPIYKDIKGPLNHFCDIAKKSQAKATRMLYVYFSDNWFLGEESDQFDNHTDIMVSLILKHVKKDGSINFTTLQRELRSKNNSLFDYVLKEYKRITKYLERLIKKAKFTHKGSQVSFAEIREVYVRKVKRIEHSIKEDSLEFLVSMWAKLIEDMPSLNNDLLIKINNYLEKENIIFHKFIKKRFTKKEIDLSLRELMVQEIQKRGFYYDKKPDFDIKTADLLKYFS